MILAGGEGSRLEPLTLDIPKAMVKVAGKPLLQWIIEWLKQNGVHEVVLGVAYLKEKIADYFGDGSDFGLRIRYSVHTVEGGTAQGFRLAISRHVDDDVFFALNGDQVCDLNLGKMALYHVRHESVATMAVTHLRFPYGVVKADRRRNIRSFIEKPLSDYLCSTGIYVFDRKILQYLPRNGDIETTAFTKLARERLLKAYPFKGFFATVNTMKDLKDAEAELKGRRTE